MKKFGILILSSLIAVAAAMLIACSVPALSSPQGLEITNKTLSWNAVENARGYTVDINGETRDIRRTTYSFESHNLPEGTYKFRVKARGNGVDFSDSAWTEIEYVQGYESGMTYTLVDDGKSYVVSSVGRAKGDIVIEDEHNGLPITGVSRLAFSNSLTVESVKLGKNITVLEDRAFYNCNNLKSITFNDGLMYIGDEAFQGCRMLTDIELPDSLQYLGVRAFGFCRGLESISLGSGIVAMSDSVFETCAALKSVILPQSLRLMGESVFNNNSSLESVVFQCKTLSMGERTFKGCTALTSVDFGECVFDLSTSMFVGCSALKTIVIPDTVSTIGDYAFSGCSELTDVKISENVTTVGANAFSNTAIYNNEQGFVVIVDKWIVGIKSYKTTVDGQEVEIVISDSVMDSYQDADIVGIANSAFYENKSLITLHLPKSLKYIGRGAFARSTRLNGVDIPDNVITIGDGAFNNCAELRAVRIGSSVQTIGSQAFSYCTSLTVDRVNIPSSVQRIGTSAFTGTSSWNSQVERRLEGGGVQMMGDGILYVGTWFVGCSSQKSGTVTITPGTTAIADYAFAYCTNLQEVVLPETVTNIGSGAFYCCGEVDNSGFFPIVREFKVNIPYGITEIKPYTFYRAIVRSIEIPTSVKTIGYSAFAGSEILTNVHMSDNVQSIGEYAFYGCSALTDVKLSKNLTKIPDFAFSGCTSLASVEIPDGVTEIGRYAFFRCEKLASVKLSEQLISIKERAFYMCALQKLAIPQNVIEIGDYAFYKCMAMSDVDFGNSLQNIGDYAFYGCVYLNNVVLPDSVSTLGESAFRYCMSLSSISLGRYITEIGSYAFYGCSYTQQTEDGTEIFHGLTIYSEASGEPSGWKWRWNSTFRPVIYGCLLSTDSDGNRYVASVSKTENSIANYNAYGGIGAPSRKGYKFIGWATEPTGEVVYAANEIYTVPNGTTLYSVWEKIPDTPPQQA